MRLARIVLLHLQEVFQHRLRSLVWFFIPLMNTLTPILYWSGALAHSATPANWNMSTLTTYYLFLSLAGSMLSSHIEEDVSYLDIEQGELVRYLLRPFPYFWFKFIEEIPYRLLQGGYGIIFISLLTVFFGRYIHITSDPTVLFLTILMWAVAFLISFLIKMNMGLLTFWFIDSRGFFELMTIATIVFSGGIVPLYLLPKSVQTISFILPFSYTAYFPIISLQGQLQIVQIVQTIGIQFMWIAILYLVNRMIWRAGIKQFTAFGQ